MNAMYNKGELETIYWYSVFTQPSSGQEGKSKLKIDELYQVFNCFQNTKIYYIMCDLLAVISLFLVLGLCQALKQ